MMVVGGLRVRGFHRINHNIVSIQKACERSDMQGDKFEILEKAPIEFDTDPIPLVILEQMISDALILLLEKDPLE